MNTYEKVNALGNIGIAFAAIAMAAVLLTNRTSSQSPIELLPWIKAGDHVGISSVDWRAGHPTLLMAINKDCYFCNASAPFYRRLSEVAKETNAHLIVISGNTPDELKQYLKSKQIPIQDVYQKTLSDVKIHATPTLVLVDSNGIASHVWRGQLQPQFEGEVISALRGKQEWTF